ncbi:tyrosine-type recombinase/integrase [Halomonas sp. CSM-2]|uniref:tyrosine-type recombinase/integrase n=1 Tax=Halomonas sp. CSM-2 TaxID=1975722 RepID=UPI000A2812BF|nr:tyrosine-type recombinase/integrase [Halomonas sp. CSM-2]
MNASTFRIRDQFDSTAKIIEITRFYFGEFTYSTSTGTDSNLNFEFHRKPGWWPNLPVLIQGNGLPWEIGNAYLLKLVETKRPWDMETIKSRATYLLAYLRFLEDIDTDFMHFPLRRSERVTYLFKDKLQDFITRGLNPLYASNIINTVVHFYRTIAEEGLVGEKEFKNSPFKDVHRFIKFLDVRGFSRFKNVTTSDLAIRHTKSHKRLDRIVDGGQLRPLSIEEQRAILSGFKNEMCPFNLELMMRITLSTGARMQTVCTIRVHHIKTAYKTLMTENASSIEIQAGNGAKNDGHLINTKNGKLHRLLFPRKLIETLYIYLTSNYHKSLMQKSYYGTEDFNYLFLTETGAPFYISKQEIMDRQNEESNHSVNSKDFIQNKGDTVRMNLKKFRQNLAKTHPELRYFKFHDLRATFGMNLVRKLNNKGYTSAQILNEVKTRMGHSNIETTQTYLDFGQLFEHYEKVSMEFEEQLLDEYESIGIEN